MVRVGRRWGSVTSLMIGSCERVMIGSRVVQLEGVREHHGVGAQRNEHRVAHHQKSLVVIDGKPSERDVASHCYPLTTFQLRPVKGSW
ncbi:hypothetical protein BDR03DRAFT_965307 [Suillus americanus]|nr:hypothetical protein BDR03DRAFT_965307 [Suillus americanus]